MTHPQPGASHEAVSSPPTPADLRGLWRREEIFTPSGHRDAATQVLWLQTERFYADIRVSPDRPVRAGVKDFDAYSDEELIKLASMQGFAGVLSASADVCLWRRDFDYQPPDPAPDEARFQIEGDRMDEFGLHADYTEIWRREPQTQEPLAAFRRETGSSGLLVIAGDRFIDLRGRERPLPDGATLIEIVKTSLSERRRDVAIAALQMQICYGVVAGGGLPWQVRLSTLPWLEQGPLFDAAVRFDPLGGILESGAERWSLLEATCAASQLSPLFEASAQS